MLRLHAEQLDKPLKRLVSLQRDATANGASVVLNTEPEDQTAAPVQHTPAPAQQLKSITHQQPEELKLLRHHVLQATEIAAGLPGLESNDVECRKVIHLLL